MTLEELIALADRCARSGLALDDHGDELCAAVERLARSAVAVADQLEASRAHRCAGADCAECSPNARAAFLREFDTLGDRGVPP